MQIKGSYEVSILIQNMFNSYMFIERNHNIVTESGLNFILQLIANKSTTSLGKIHVGTNDGYPSPYDDVSTFENAQALSHSSITVEDNVLTYNVSTEGRNISGTNEIGIWSNDETILVTRDVHDTYDVPDNATITIKYSLELSNKSEEEEEDYND